MPKKSFNALLYAAVFILVAAILIALYYSSNPNAVVVEGILIASDDENPFDAFSSLANRDSFIVSPQFYEPIVTLDQYMSNGALLFIQVLNGNRREATLLIRVYDNENQFLYCSTNYGDVTTQATLSVEECNALLNSGENALILIQFPDNAQTQPIIELSNGKIVIKPKSYEDIANTSFLALKIMYRNAAEVLQASNALVGKIKPGQSDFNNQKPG